MEIVFENGAQELQVHVADALMAIPPPRNSSSRLWLSDSLEDHHNLHYHHRHQTAMLIDPMSGFPAVRRARPLIRRSFYSCRGPRRSSSLGSTSESSDYDTDSEDGGR